MNNKKTIQKILIGLGIAIALLVVYSMLAPGTENQGVGEKTGLTSLLDSSVLGQIEETDTKLANAEVGAFVAGAKVPCILSSRGDSVATKLYSIALGAMIASK